MIFQTQKPELLWEGTDHDGDKPLLFTVYLSTEEDNVFNLDPTALLVLNTEETKFKFDIPLKDSATYYWTVIPNDGKIDGSCDSGIWHFKIDTSVEIPKVTLIAPFHNYSISSTNPELSWSVNYSQVDILKYNVFIDIKPDPENFIPDFDYVSYIPTTPLVRGSTYYWTVIPIAESEDGTVQGECESGVWKFKVDSKPDRVYGLELDLESLNLNVGQGDDVITNITVRNTGNFPDIISLKLTYSDFQGKIELKAIEIPFTLNANQSKSIKLAITTYEYAEVRGYLVDITAISQGARSELEDVSVTKTLQVRVTEQEASTGQDGTEKGEGDYLIWILVLIVLVIIILAAFFVVKRKKKEQKVAPEVDAEVLYKPSKPSLIPDKIDKGQVKGKGKEPEMEVLEPDIEEQPEILTKKTYQPRLKPKVKKPKVQQPELISEPSLDQIPEPATEPDDIQSQFDQMPTLEPEVVEGELVGDVPAEVEVGESQPTPSVDVHLPGDVVEEPEVTLPDEQVDEGGPEVMLPDEVESEKPIRKLKKGQKGLE
jgi:hypothetical protein